MVLKKYQVQYPVENPLKVNRTESYRAVPCSGKAPLDEGLNQWSLAQRQRAPGSLSIACREHSINGFNLNPISFILASTQCVLALEFINIQVYFFQCKTVRRSVSAHIYSTFEMYSLSFPRKWSKNIDDSC